jgi:hypothetical protein
MLTTRRDFLLRLAAVAGCSLTGWTKPSRPCTASGSRAAVRFLSTRQSLDGAWRSTRYGFFRDGDALTPLVLWGLLSAKTIAEENAETVGRGLRWLEKLTAKQVESPEPWAELHYPLFTGSYAAQIFANVGDLRRATFWADLVERLRIDKALGWPVNDPACGAWSDAPAPPQLPSGISSPPDMLAPNVSATLLGLRALLAVQRPSGVVSAQPFLRRCQNFPVAGESGFDDGGFFFAIDDPVRNKAGVAGHDASGERYHSYGSATCDGILGLHASGLKLDHPRMRAAMAWLCRHAAGARHGGEWPTARADERDSLIYYNAQALTDALRIASASELKCWAVEQGNALINDLLVTQDRDGAWTGPCPNSFEDDPLVATSFALRALCQCEARFQPARMPRAKNAR